MKIPKRVDPATEFTCATCKRVRPVAERRADRLVCVDRQACAEALADWMSKRAFAIGVAKP